MQYIDILPDLVYSYNHSIHRSIKRKPADNEKQVWHMLYHDHNGVKQVKYKFNTGDQVRIGKIKRTFEKGYLPNFSRDIHHKQADATRSARVQAERLRR